ncbi:unnamed protein product [Amaranthus hypochondriacus]
MPIMPIRPKGSEGPQRPSLTTSRGPRHVRTYSSDSDPLHHRPITERSPRVGDYRSPRGTQSDPPIQQKKLGTRITHLETQLVQAQHELKSLKHQLTSAEAARKQAQEELHKKGGKKQITTKRVVGRGEPTTVAQTRKSNSKDKPEHEVPEYVQRETDVFEVPMEKNLIEPEVELSQCSVVEHVKEKLSSFDEAAAKNEVDEMTAIMEEKEKEMSAVTEENESLKKQLDEAKSEIALARTREEETASKLNQLEQDLEVSKAIGVQLKQKLVDAEAAKELLENDMKKMKVQTEQWRKAADAAASVLACGVDMKGRISDRCSSMDNHFTSIFEMPPITGFGGYLGSPGAGDDDADDSFGGGKKKGSGIRMLGELWKKKGQK